MSIDKKTLRKEMLARRDALSLQERKEKSERIAKLVLGLEEFQNANVVLLYDSIRSEVEAAEIAQDAKRQNKMLYYPRVMGREMKFYLVDDTTEMEISPYGIREPNPESTVEYKPSEVDKVFVLMPGAAFDKEGNRIGYGGGYYDKYLHWLEVQVKQERIYKTAVAYECQLVELGGIESERHDVRVDCVVTEKQLYRS